MEQQQNQTALAVVDIAGAKAVGEVFYASGFFTDVKSEAQAMVKVLAGQELGVPPFAAIQGIEIVEGKPSIKPVLMAALIRKSRRYDYAVLITNAERAEIAFYAIDRPGDLTSKRYLGASEYTIERAAKAGLSGKHNWRTKTQEMLYWRAMSAGARLYCPDVFIGGVYVEGELDETPNNVAPTPAPETPNDVPATTAFVVGSAVLPEVEFGRVAGVDDETRLRRSAVPERFGHRLQVVPCDDDDVVVEDAEIVEKTPEPVRMSEPVAPPEPVEPTAKDPTRLCISAQMARNMLRLAEANGFSVETLAVWIKSRGFEKSTAITRADYPTLIDAIESGEAFAEWQRAESRRRAAEIVDRENKSAPAAVVTESGEKFDPATGEVTDVADAKTGENLGIPL